MKLILMLMFLIMAACTTIDEPEQPKSGYIYRVDEYGHWEKVRPMTEKEIILNTGGTLI